MAVSLGNLHRRPGRMGTGAEARSRHCNRCADSESRLRRSGPARRDLKIRPGDLSYARNRPASRPSENRRGSRGSRTRAGDAMTVPDNARMGPPPAPSLPAPLFWLLLVLALAATTAGIDRMPLLDPDEGRNVAGPRDGRGGDGCATAARPT